MITIKLNKTEWTIAENTSSDIEIVKETYTFLNPTEKAIWIAVERDFYSIDKEDGQVFNESHDKHSICLAKSQIKMSDDTIEIVDWLAAKNGITSNIEKNLLASSWAIRIGQESDTEEIHNVEIVDEEEQKRLAREERMAAKREGRDEKSLIEAVKNSDVSKRSQAMKIAWIMWKHDFNGNWGECLKRAWWQANN